MRKTQGYNIELLKFILWFSLACVLSYWLEHQVIELVESKKYQRVSSSIFDLEQVYQKIITAGPREFTQNYTSIIDLGSGLHSLQRVGACGQRKFMGKLLDVISKEKPAVIVIDKYYKAICDTKTNGENGFVDKIREISLHTPIIIGRAIDTSSTLSSLNETISSPVLEESIQLSENPEQKITEGIVNTESDIRRLPLLWRIREKVSDSYSNSIPSLSWAAVEAYYKSQNKLNYPARLKRILTNEVSPYVGFIEKQKFRILLADAIEENKSNSVIVSDRLHNSEAVMQELRGKIVIIGESNSRMDNHETPIGKMSGFIIQSNYIEALLDQRYYEPAPVWLDYSIGFFIFSAVYFGGMYISSIWKLIAYEISVLGMAFIIIYLIVACFGWFINPITINTLALAIVLFHRLFPHYIARKRAHHE